MPRVINENRLFFSICIALVVASLTFAIRANLIGTLSNEFGLTPLELGNVIGAAFWGFTVAMLLGGLLCDLIGLKSMFILAFLGHFIGIVLTIISKNYLLLFISTLFVGLGNGFIESASYTLISSLYPKNKTIMLSKWHIWFPAGIVIGGLLAWGLALLSISWRIQMAVILVPTIFYGILMFNQIFPRSERISLGVTYREMFKECINPLFIFMVLCMLLTSATELGTNQWIAELLSEIGVPSILLLVFINGIMTIGRANAGKVLSKFSSINLLIISSILSCLGLLWLGHSEGYLSFVAAGIFALGICFFWPLMIGFVSENLPKTGPLGLSIMGGAGLLSTALIQPFFSQVFNSELNKLLPFNKSLENLKSSSAGPEAAEILHQIRLEAGANTLTYVAILPGVLILAFIILQMIIKKRKQKSITKAYN